MRKVGTERLRLKCKTNWRREKHTEKAEFVLSGRQEKKRERPLVGLKFSAPPEGKILVLGCHVYNRFQGRI